MVLITYENGWAVSGTWEGYNWAMSKTLATVLVVGLLLITAVTGYGYPVVAAVQKGRVTGFQFHPEKSSAVGLAMLRRLVEL